MKCVRIGSSTSWCLKKKLAIIARWAEPHATKEIVLGDPWKIGEPEDPVDELYHRPADRLGALLGMGNDEYAELVLSEEAFMLPPPGKLEIVFYLFPPDAERLSPEVNFKERCDGSRRGREFHIAVRDEAESLSNRLSERDPAPEGNFWERDRTILQAAIEIVHP